MFLDLY